MRNATIHTEPLIIPTYPEPEKEELPLFAEHRVHQRSSGRPYPNKATLEVTREGRADKCYTAVHMENDYLDVWILPEIGGRIFAAQDKTTGYDFFYRQHVIKPGLIGALGSWISGGVEFNWPYHHRPSGYMPCDYRLEECADGSVICWLSEHDPVDRMKGMVGIVLRPDTTYIETRMQLCNRTAFAKSFLWWENAAVPVNKSYQIFFPKDVTYVNFHYLDSRISYPIAGDGCFNGIDMSRARDISLHRNTKDATSYFACESAYDFFGGYDHGLGCGVVHIGDHHVSPGKKMFTWAYNQLSKTWENTLTDSDGQYAELMAGSYTNNQPDFSWLEPYETKQFSQYWYPIGSIGTPDYADLNGALSLHDDKICLQTTRTLGALTVTVSDGRETLLSAEVYAEAGKPVELPWQRPQSLVSVTVRAGTGTVAHYEETRPDMTKKPPVKDPMPVASEVPSADELYLAGVHVEQYRDPAVMPDAYWLEALKRDPQHVGALLGMSKYSLLMASPEKAESYARKALRVLTRFNTHPQSGDPFFLLAQSLEAQERYDEAYDLYYKAGWNGSAVSKAMIKLACIDLRRGSFDDALRHARQAQDHDRLHPLAPAVIAIALRSLGRADEAEAELQNALRLDCLNRLVQWLLAGDKDAFFTDMHSDPAQTVLDIAFDLESMGQYASAVRLLEEYGDHHPRTAMTLFASAYLKKCLQLPYAFELAAADKAPVGNAYPSRPVEARVLRWAIGEGSRTAPFLLGCLLYDKRQYSEAAALFAEATRLEPDNYMAYRSLAVAYFSHLDRKDEAVQLMEKARALHCSQQILYESVILLDLMGADPAEKLRLLKPHSSTFRRDDLFVELAKAYNQNRQPDEALRVLMNHTFIACEGGEHAIADQYMFAYFQLGAEKQRVGAYDEALRAFSDAMTLPQSLGSGIWNRCKYVPYQFRMAQCLEKLGRGGEARELYETILSIQLDFFSRMHLPELPYYQARAAEALGLPQRAWNILGCAKRQWSRALEQTDNGFFATTPFFISFVQQPAILHRAYYLYLLAFIALFCGETERARSMFRESCLLNGDSMFCRFYAENV